MAYDATNEQVVVFGGIDTSTHRSDTWIWDGVTWTQASPASVPQARSSAALAFDEISGAPTLFGGSSANLDRSDTWTWDGHDWVSQDAPVPEAGFGGAAGYDALREEVVLLGGNVDKGLSGETWTWNGAWSLEEPLHSPAPRSDAVIAFDSERNELVLFGGFGAGGTELGDTWVWNGEDWIERDTTIAPVARHNAVMAYDSSRHEIVLWGGSNSDLGVVLNDTWTWDGTSWSLELPARSPVARSGATMAYDPARDQMVLFGGYDANVAYTSDTWTWDGSTWTRADPDNVPPARSAGAATYDPVLGGVLLFGGNYGLGKHAADTWVWTGNDWLDVGSGQTPQGRWDPAFVYDAALGSAVLFGGNANTFLDDTWLLEAGDGPPVPKEPVELYAGQGRIAIGNPGAGLGGITATELERHCESPPLSQGADGWVFTLPFTIDKDGKVTAVATAAGSPSDYDLDLAFFSATCRFLGASATDAPKERSEVPRGTKFVVVNAAGGRDLAVEVRLLEK
jgi:hypothetical protein